MGTGYTRTVIATVACMVTAVLQPAVADTGFFNDA